MFTPVNLSLQWFTSLQWIFHFSQSPHFKFASLKGFGVLDPESSPYLQTILSLATQVLHLGLSISFRLCFCTRSQLHINPSTYPSVLYCTGISFLHFMMISNWFTSFRLQYAPGQGSQLILQIINILPSPGLHPLGPALNKDSNLALLSILFQFLSYHPIFV